MNSNRKIIVNNKHSFPIRVLLLFSLRHKSSSVKIFFLLILCIYCVWWWCFKTINCFCENKINIIMIHIRKKTVLYYCIQNQSKERFSTRLLLLTNLNQWCTDVNNNFLHGSFRVSYSDMQIQFKTISNCVENIC